MDGKCTIPLGQKLEALIFWIPVRTPRKKSKLPRKGIFEIQDLVISDNRIGFACKGDIRSKSNTLPFLQAFPANLPSKSCCFQTCIELPGGTGLESLDEIDSLDFVILRRIVLRRFGFCKCHDALDLKAAFDPMPTLRLSYKLAPIDG